MMQGRILGLDVGDKRIGIAISDAMGWTAQPLMTLERTTLEKDLDALEKIIQENYVVKIVVGIPRQLSLKTTVQTQKVIDFKEILKKTWPTLTIEEWDEWFSTQSAKKLLINEADISRKKQKKAVDKLAAQFILQGYLDTQK